MIALSALAAFSLISLPGGLQSSGMVTLAGRVVPIVFPSGEVVQVPADVQQWDGFKGANAKGGDWPTPFEAPGDWSAVRAKLEALGPVPKDSPVLQVKVFVFDQVDVKAGPSVQTRHRLNQEQIDAVLRSLARVNQYVRAATDGAANLRLDVELIGEQVLVSTGSESRWLPDFIAARSNRGEFSSEDKVYRGPYNAILALTPAGFSFLATHLSDGLDQKDGFGLDKSILNALGGQLQRAWNDFQIFPVPQPGSGAAGASLPQWPLHFDRKKFEFLSNRTEPTFEQVTSIFGLDSERANSPSAPLVFPGSPSPISSNVSLAIVEDADRGKVLEYKEKSTVRFGGFALPYAGPATKRYLKFWMKSSSLDPLSVSVEHNRKGIGFHYYELPALRDGKWHEVVVDLALSVPGDTRTGRINLAPGPGGIVRDQVGDIVYYFDDFELLESANSTPFIVPETLNPNEISAAALANLPDHEKLNCLSTRQVPYAVADEPALIQLSKSVNVRIAGLAVQRLAELGTPTAKAEVLRLVTASPFEHVKQVAAIEVGKVGDPKNAPVLSRLFGSKSWQTRMAGATAVSMLPGDQAAVIAMTFLQENDPMVRLAATRGAHTDNPTVLKRLLWSAVNDPSDAVRAESAWKLITSGKEKEVAEGYKSVRDESVGVRLDLLDRFTKNPSEAHRGALRIAVVDLSARVRAATLRAFAKQPGEVVLDEVSNTFTDKFPIVQFALLDLAKAKSLKLPDAAIANLKSSIDPRVVERAKELG